MAAAARATKCTNPRRQPIAKAQDNCARTLTSSVAKNGEGAVSLVLGAVAATVMAASAASASEKQLATFDASGVIFKNQVEVVSVEDPQVRNAIIYVSDFKRSLSAKLARKPFSDPSQASVTCASKSEGPQPSSGVKDNEEVFSQSRGGGLLAGKTLRVRRLIDWDNGVVVYVSYATRLSSSESASDGPSPGQYKTSICALPLAPSSVPSSSLSSMSSSSSSAPEKQSSASRTARYSGFGVE